MASFPLMPFGYNYTPNYPAYFGSEVAPYYQDFDRTFKSMEREMNHMKHWMDRSFHNWDKHHFSTDLINHPSRPSNMIEHYSLLNPIRVDHEGNRWLNCYFDLRSYKPEEINVTLDSKNRYVNVEAHHEVKDSKDHYIKRSYSRKVYIPTDVKIDLSKLDLKSCLTNEGLLCIEAVLPKLSLEEARSASSAGKTPLSTANPAVFNIAVKTV